MKLILFTAIFLLAGCSSKSSVDNGNATTGNSSIRLNWAAPSGDVQGYYIEQAVGTGSYNLVSTVIAPTTTVTITNLVKGTRYAYRIRAFTAGGTSNYTLSAVATP